MRIDGVWHLCDDGMVRPVIRGEVQCGDGSWIKAPFLGDSGADRAVFSADVLEALQLRPIASADQVSGVGGSAASVVVETQIRFSHEDGGKAAFRGQFAGFTALESLDICVLGRDILNLFAFIVDRQGDTVCLIGQQHYYNRRQARAKTQLMKGADFLRPGDHRQCLTGPRRRARIFLADVWFVPRIAIQIWRVRRAVTIFLVAVAERA